MEKTKIKPISAKLRGEEFEFHPSGAAFWKKHKILLISDVHLGKVSHFRKYGSAVPHQAIGTNFLQLNKVLETYKPEKIFFLGDLFHSVVNSEWQLFEEWIENVPSQVMLVAGNHDVISPLKYEEIGIEVTKEIILDKFHLTHHPEEREGLFNICGHLHPGYRMRGLGRQSLKLPCFYTSKERLILPAFGEFTGNYFIEPQPGDEIYVLTKNEVLLVYSEK